MKNVKVVNLTPHDVNVMDEEGNTLMVFPSEGIARLLTQTVHHEPFVLDDGTKIPTSSTEFGEVQGLPEPADGVVYIVSSLIAGYYPLRGDLYIPNESVRDDKGRIIGCKSLGRI